MAEPRPGFRYAPELQQHVIAGTPDLQPTMIAAAPQMAMPIASTLCNLMLPTLPVVSSAPVTWPPLVAAPALQLPPGEPIPIDFGLRKTAWHASEDMMIRKMVDKVGTRWDLIAAILPGRSEDAVRNRYHRMHREAKPKVDRIALSSELQRAPAMHHTNERWTAEEDRLILEGVQQHGCRWRKVAALLVGRSDSSVRNRYNRLIERSKVDAAASDAAASEATPKALSAAKDCCADPERPAFVPSVVACRHEETWEEQALRACAAPACVVPANDVQLEHDDCPWQSFLHGDTTDVDLMFDQTALAHNSPHSPPVGGAQKRKRPAEAHEEGAAADGGAAAEEGVADEPDVETPPTTDGLELTLPLSPPLSPPDLFVHQALRHAAGAQHLALLAMKRDSAAIDGFPLDQLYSEAQIRQRFVRPLLIASVPLSLLILSYNVGIALASRVEPIDVPVDTLLQLSLYIGAPLAALVLSAALFPHELPAAALPYVQALAVIAAASKIQGTWVIWTMGYHNKVDEQEMSIVVRRTLILSSACGAVARAAVIKFDGQLFWWSNRALSAFNGIILLAAAAALRWLEGPEPAKEPLLMNGQLSLMSSTLVGLCLLACAACLSPPNRKHISRAGLALKQGVLRLRQLGSK